MLSFIFNLHEKLSDLHLDYWSNDAPVCLKRYHIFVLIFDHTKLQILKYQKMKYETIFVLIRTSNYLLWEIRKLFLKWI